jgi:hypothetical protein
MRSFLSYPDSLDGSNDHTGNQEACFPVVGFYDHGVGGQALAISNYLINHYLVDLLETH